MSDIAEAFEEIKRRTLVGLQVAFSFFSFLSFLFLFFYAFFSLFLYFFISLISLLVWGEGRVGGQHGLLVPVPVTSDQWPVASGPVTSGPFPLLDTGQTLLLPG